MSKISIKVTDAKKARRFGLVVSSVDELLRRSCAFFNINASVNGLYVSLEDGTEVTDDSYLLSLTPQSLLIIFMKNERHETGNSHLIEAIKNYFQAAEALQQFKPSEVEILLTEHNGKRMKSAVQWINSLPKSKAHLSAKTEHREWFEGCNKLVNSKEEYFRKCAQGRIRSYLRDARSKLSESVVLTKILQFFREGLDSHSLYACYFDRSTLCEHRLCDALGKFMCQGKFNQDSCQDIDHHINPYSNAESRILFTTWNLDHVIERRNILNSLENQVNVECDEQCYKKYFDLLFTLRNLKLVHRNCHVIGPHGDCIVHHKHSL